MASTDQSLKLAWLWVRLDEMKRELDNEIIPVATHLSIEDPQLMIALEEVSERIASHFEKFRLQATGNRPSGH